MTIYDFIKEKELAYLEAQLVMMKGTYSEKDLKQLKDKIYDIKNEDKFVVLGYTDCLNEEVKSTEFTGSCNIVFNDAYIYNPDKNVISKIAPNQGYDLREGFKACINRKRV